MAQFKSDALQILSERGFVHQYTDLEGLDRELAAGSITAYCGYDPTADSLHIGHLITITMLYWLQETGHRPITLMGGATAMIGDPGGKDKQRPMMTVETIDNNIAGIKTAFGHLLRYGDSGNDAFMVNNADWFRGLGYLEFLREYGTHFSVNRMLTMDSVKSRLDREQHMSFLEFNYSLLQAFDFAKLYKEYGCLLQISGGDQWGNIIGGVELGRRKENAMLYGLTAALLTDPNGKKMGKSEGNALWINPEKQSDYDYYQYWRNVDDSQVKQMLGLFTHLPMDEVARLAALGGSEINEAKKILAFEATRIMRGGEAAANAAQTALDTFAGAGRSDGLPKLHLEPGETTVSVVDLLVRAGICPSKGEARRMIKGNGVRINEQPVTDEAATVATNDFDAENSLKLSAGKKRHVLVIKA